MKTTQNLEEFLLINDNKSSKVDVNVDTNWQNVRNEMELEQYLYLILIQYVLQVKLVQNVTIPMNNLEVMQ